MKVLSESVIRNSYLEQAQLTQAHRWIAAIQGCEQTNSLTNLLAPETKFTVNAKPVPLNPRRLPNLDQLGVKAIQTQSTDRSTGSGHSIHIDASSLRLDANQSHNKATIELSFDDADAQVPLIVAAKLTLGEQVDAPKATALPWLPHRLLALKHRWHTLGECPRKSAPPYKDIITTNFVMDWGTGSVNSYAELTTWLEKSAASVAAARHDIESFTWSTLAAGVHQSIFVFNWSGISLGGKPMQAKSRHTWRVFDNGEEAYPRLDHMQVEFIEPFHVVA